MSEGLAIDHQGSVPPAVGAICSWLREFAHQHWSETQRAMVEEAIGDFHHRPYLVELLELAPASEERNQVHTGFSALLSLVRWLQGAALNPLERGAEQTALAKDMAEAASLALSQLWQQNHSRLSEPLRRRILTAQALHGLPDSPLPQVELSELLAGWAKESPWSQRGAIGHTFRHTSRLLDYAAQMPLRWLRRWAIRRRLPRSLFQNEAIAETYFAIEQLGPVVDAFCFGNSDTAKTSPRSAGADVAFLYMQLADELVDNLVKAAGPKQVQALVEDVYPTSQRDLQFIPFENLQASHLEAMGVAPDKPLEKYDLSFGQMLELLAELRTCLLELVKQPGVQSPEAAGAEVQGFFRHCFATFLDELWLASDGQNPAERPVESLLWHFYRKNNLVMTRWLHLRALLLGIDPAQFARPLQRWGYLLANFQVFDDLKDMGVDVNEQPNYALQHAFAHQADEFHWLARHRSEFGASLQAQDVLWLRLAMPASTQFAMGMGRLMAYAHFDWILHYVADHRWRKNWTSTFRSFHGGKRDWRLENTLGVTEAGYGRLPALHLAFFHLLERTHRHLPQLGEVDYFSWLVELLAYDSRLLVYRYVAPDLRGAYRFAFLRTAQSEAERANWLELALLKNPHALALGLVHFEDRHPHSPASAPLRKWLSKHGLAAQLPEQALPVALKPGNPRKSSA